MKKASRRLILITLVILLLISVIGCESNPQSSDTSGQPETTRDPNASVAETTPSANDTTVDNESSKVDAPNPAFVIDNAVYKVSMAKCAVNIRIINNPGVSSIAVTVDYDKNALKLLGFTFNGEIGGQSVPFNDNVPEVKLVWLNWEGDVTGDWLFATLYFEVLDTDFDRFDISLHYDPDDVYNSNEQNVTFDIISGGITKDN